MLKIVDFSTEVEKYKANLDKLNQGIIPDDWKCKVIKAGNEVIITASSMKQHSAIRKLDKKHYAVRATGEIREFNSDRKKKRTDNFRSLQKSLSHLRNLINTNFSSDKLNQAWITLTYKKHQSDNKQVISDMKQLIKKLRRHYQVADTKLEYIYILEPQASGSWHVHLLVRLDNSENLYIPKYKLNKLWGHGSAMIKTAKDGIEHIANYVSACLSNSESTEQLEYEMKTQLGIKDTKPTKKYEKYSRLKFYRQGMKFYYRSKGIKEPEQKTMTYQDIKKELTEGQFRENYKKISNFKTSNHTEVITVFIQFYKKSIVDTLKINKPFEKNSPASLEKNRAIRHIANLPKNCNLNSFR